MKLSSPLLTVLWSVSGTSAFVTFPTESFTLALKAAADDEVAAEKEKLFQLLGMKASTDPVLADPITKEEIQIKSAPGVVFGGENKRSIQYEIVSASNQFQGSSDTYINLLEPVSEESSSSEPASNNLMSDLLRQAGPYVPVPLRQTFSALTGSEYIPMRDLFTSPSVSFLYERGWRQAFAQAGFPGSDVEAEMAMDYFAPAAAKSGDISKSVLVDMSCATGLFTRIFASQDKYGRVLGCDYSESMLTEARRRISEESKLSALKTTKLDLVRLDVGQIPMKDETIDCLHAGAAMHCWPDLDAAASEIYRVLKPNGRYFATTFLSPYFSNLSRMDGQTTTVSQQAYQYFESIDTLKELLERGGFESDKIQIEVLGTACAVIRAEK